MESRACLNCQANSLISIAPAVPEWWTFPPNPQIRARPTIACRLALWALALNFAQPVIERWRRREGAGGLNPESRLSDYG